MSGFPPKGGWNFWAGSGSCDLCVLTDKQVCGLSSTLRGQRSLSAVGSSRQMCLGLAANRRDFSVVLTTQGLSLLGSGLHCTGGLIQDGCRTKTDQLQYSKDKGKDNKELAGCWRDCQPWGRVCAEGGSWAQTSKVCWGGQSPFEGHILRPGQQSRDSVLQRHTQKPCKVQASSGRRLRACATAPSSSHSVTV